MIKFTYTNRGTHAAVTKEGKQIMHTNQIRLWREDDGTLKYDRRYVSSNGKVDGYSSAIEHTFVQKQMGDRKIPHSAIEVAQQIHWGCCGWSANSTQIWQLVRDVKHIVPD